MTDYPKREYDALRNDVMFFDFRRRIVGLQEKMDEFGLDLVVYGSCQNFQYLTGLLIGWRRSVDLGAR